MRTTEIWFLILMGLMGCINEADWKNVCDKDGDGAISAQSECPDMFPEADIDCDDSTSTITTEITFHLDSDNDGYGGPHEQKACPADMPGGYVDNDSDCDDGDATINPNADEYACDDVDSNCNGSDTDGTADTWYADLDSDGFGDPESMLESCDQPTGHVDNNEDCNDGDATINPEAEEDCIGGVDDDCNGIVDDGPESTVWYYDNDIDGFGNPDNAVAVCDDSEPEGTVSDNTDCDDTDANVNPDATEVCDNYADDDCDGTVDDDAIDSTWYADTDNDGFGDVNNTIEDCAPPEGYTADNTDCDDTDNSIHPDAEEVCLDGVDNNCNDDPDHCILSGTISLSTADVTLEGSDADGRAGEKLQSLGDIDEDGTNDLMVGAPSSGSGQGMFVYGPISNMNLSDAGRVFEGDSSGELATWSTGVGDIDDDGVQDLVVLAPGADEVYTYLGPITSGGTGLSHGNADVLLSADSGEYPVANSICDVDGDGDDDLIIGAHREATGGTNAGGVFIYEGPIDTDDDLDNATFMFYGDENSLLGTSVSCGDISGDGIADLIIGAPDEDDTGAVHIIYGPPPGSGSQDIATYADVSLAGEATDDHGGWNVEFIGDFDGDGNGDFAVSAYTEDTGGSDAGAVYLFHTPTGSDLGDADTKLIGEAVNDYAGGSISGNCDVNGDGYDDLLMGAYGANVSTGDEGKTYLFYGLATGLSSSASLSTADITFTGIDSGDRSGAAVECMQDSDGYDDIVIGAPYSDSYATDAGSVYIFHGTTY